MRLASIFSQLLRPASQVCEGNDNDTASYMYKGGNMLLVVSLVLAFFLLNQNPSFSAALDHPVVFVKQTKVDHSGGAIQDVIGNFRGAHPALDQPTGGGLFLLTPSGELRMLVGGADIAVRDPEISENGRKVIFAMKQGGNGKWQIYECDVDGNNLRKLSQNSRVNDFDPAYLPYEKIAFLSDRLGLAEPFQNHPSAQLHIMYEDGTGAISLNANPGGQSNPVSLFVQSLGYGVILFSEFDYHDRRKSIQKTPDPLAVSRFLPWFVYRDGSAFDHPLFGTHTIPDFAGGYIQVREVPGKEELIGTFTNQEKTFGAGSTVTMKYTRNDDREAPAFLTANVFDLKENNPGGRWRDPYPLSDGSILASYASGPVYQSKAQFKPSEIPDFKIVRLSADGKNQETIYEDSKFWCWQPVEVTSRRAIPFSIGVSIPEIPYAMINSLDVFNRGVNSKKVVNGDSQPVPQPGSIEFVRILKMKRQRNTNRSFAKYSSTKFVELGKAPVFTDGSFAALVPMDTPLLWELVDRSGKVVVRERFGTTLKAGEIRQCYGCHAPHDGRTGNISNQAQPKATNLTRFDPDVDKNGVLDILEAEFHYEGQ